MTIPRVWLALSLLVTLSAPALAAEPKPTPGKPKTSPPLKAGKPATKTSAKKPKPSHTKVPAFAEEIQCQAPAQRIITHRNKDTTVECRLADKNGAYVLNHGPWLGLRDGDKNPHTRGYYKGAKKAGDWLYYYPQSGKVWIKGSWADDQGTGTWFVSDEDGDLQFKGSWNQFEQFRKQDSPRGGNWTFWMNK